MDNPRTELEGYMGQIAGVQCGLEALEVRIKKRNAELFALIVDKQCISGHLNKATERLIDMVDSCAKMGEGVI